MKHSFQCDKTTALVKTAKGMVKGYAHDGLLIFKGIPYAKARRFHAPEEPDEIQGVFDASNYGYVCPLLTNDRPNGELNVPHRFWPMDEDCLNLNVWTPAADDAKRPVLVWLHGGGFEAGSAIEHIAYDGANMSREGDAVVVSINHRLNILGYFDLSDYGEEYANSGNAGGDDIIASLRWVHENIAAFGGDPDNVTVFGQSGGGAKVTTLLQSPAADGLYAKGYVMSGVIGPVLADAVGSGKDLAEALMRELGVPEEDIADGAKGVKALEAADYHDLAKAYVKIRPALQAAGKYVGGAPHPNAFYKGEPVANGFREETKDIPLLVGSVYGEFTSFVPAPWQGEELTEEEQTARIRGMLGGEGADALIPLFREAYPERRLIDLLRLDFIFRAPEIDYIAERSKLNKCTWSYLFNMDQPVYGGSTPWHCSDIPYVFNNIDLVEYPHGPSEDENLSERIQKECFESVLAFARTGCPDNSAIPSWPACEEGKENTLIIDAHTRVRENHDHALMPVFMRYMGPVFGKMMAEMMGNVQH